MAILKLFNSFLLISLIFYQIGENTFNFHCISSNALDNRFNIIVIKNIKNFKLTTILSQKDWAQKRTSSEVPDSKTLLIFLYFTIICLFLLLIGETIIPPSSICEDIPLEICDVAAVIIILSNGICSFQPRLPSAYFGTIL